MIVPDFSGDNNNIAVATIDLSSYSSATLSWDEDVAYPTWYASSTVEISTDGGSTWVELANSDGTDGVLVSRSVDVSAYAGGSVMIGFRHVGNYAHAMTISNVAMSVPDVVSSLETSGNVSASVGARPPVPKPMNVFIF